MKIEHLKRIAELDVEIVAVSGYGSWRGSYSKPAIFFNKPIKEYVSSKVLLDVLEDLFSGKIFYAYKGDEVSFSGEEEEIYLEFFSKNIDKESIFSFIKPVDVKKVIAAFSEDELRELAIHGYSENHFFDYEWYEDL